MNIRRRLEVNCEAPTEGSGRIQGDYSYLYRLPKVVPHGY